MRTEERACDYLMVVLFFMLVFGCAPAATDSRSTTAPQPGQPGPGTVVSNAVVKDNGGNVLAYFLGFMPAGNEQSDGLFILPTGEVANFNMLTGSFEYESVWFASNNCTGQAYVPRGIVGFNGMVTGRVIQGGGKAYKFGGTYNGATFSPVTQWTGVICYTLPPGSGVPDVSSGDFLFTKQTSTYSDLSSVAPVVLTTE